MRVLEFLFGLLFFSTILIGWALLWNAPLIAALVLLRRQLTIMVPRLLLAAGFCVSTIWLAYGLDSDIWRHGVPSVSYMLQAYLSYGLLLFAVGWGLGSLIAPKEKRRTALSVRRRALSPEP